jgi:predicted nuclease with TOPRIM domain
VSQPEGNGQPGADSLATLEAAVGTALERLAAMSKRVTAAEAKSAEFGEIVKRITGDEADAGRLLSRLKRLEDENADLHHRLDQGRAGVDRLLARIRFLENQK